MENISKPERLLIATRNAGKTKEFSDLLRPLGISLVSLREVANISEPQEDGETFLENAVIKAVHYALRAGEWALADDSGLSIDVLGGRPGIHSARYGGAATNYIEKMSLLLDEIKLAGGLDRKARFTSALALSDPSGRIRISAEGVCEGTIANDPRGNSGFGYDPIFLPVGHDRTFGELTYNKKQQLSHRAMAAKEFIHKMLDFTGV